MSDSEFCSFIKQIQKDPFKKVEGLTIGKVYQLQEHLKECQECIRITDEILEENKDIPSDPDSEWERSKYN
jgi:hypothetical protein